MPPDTASTCPTFTALMLHRCTSETGLYLFLMTKGTQESKNCTSRSTIVVYGYQYFLFDFASSSSILKTQNTLETLYTW